MLINRNCEITNNEHRWNYKWNWSKEIYAAALLIPESVEWWSKLNKE